MEKLGDLLVGALEKLERRASKRTYLKVGDHILRTLMVLPAQQAVDIAANVHVALTGSLNPVDRHDIADDMVDVFTMMRDGMEPHEIAAKMREKRRREEQHTA